MDEDYREWFSANVYSIIEAMGENGIAHFHKIGISATLLLNSCLLYIAQQKKIDMLDLEEEAHQFSQALQSLVNSLMKRCNLENQVFDLWHKKMGDEDGKE